MSPPDLPPTTFYRPLRELLAAIKAGGVLRPTTPEDIQTGKRPPAVRPPGSKAVTVAPAPQGSCPACPCSTPGLGFQCSKCG